uniref:Cytochrome P450 family 4 subfamily F member 8 n=1 Tax=Varanus komodoensis TaxID=61221 RepID=A0A8D2LJG8_VARKO
MPDVCTQQATGLLRLKAGAAHHHLSALQQGVPNDDHPPSSLPGGGRWLCPGPCLPCSGPLAACGPRLGVLLVPQGLISPSLPKWRVPVSQLQIGARRRRPCWPPPPLGDMPPCLPGCSSVAPPATLSLEGACSRGPGELSRPSGTSPPPLGGSPAWSQGTLPRHTIVLVPPGNVGSDFMIILFLQARWCRQTSGGPASLDMFEHISLITLDSLRKCVFSLKAIVKNERSSDDIAAILELSSLVVRHQHQLLRHFDWVCHWTADGHHFHHACAIMHRFTANVIRQQRITLSHLGRDAWVKSKQDETMDFIDLLLSKDEEGHHLSDEDITAEVDTFMCESHDTTASALSWVLYNLARHPKYQDRCWEEIQDLMLMLGLLPFLREDLSQMPFITVCIVESLCLHSPDTVISRSCTEDTLPSTGNTCLLSIYGTHHNPAVWPEPEAYNPDRFDPATIQQQPPLAFVPFSTGKHNFAKSELKVVLALTLLRFPELILKAENGLWLWVEPLLA